MVTKSGLSHWKAMGIIAFALMFYPGFGHQRPPWEQWQRIMGDWSGEGTGEPGRGEGTFSFQLALDQKILIRKSHTEFPATDQRPSFVHEDLLIVYADPSGIPERGIYFDNEGHTIEYTVSCTDHTIQLVSGALPGAPFFRLTYTQLDQNSILTKFEMSQDGQTFMTYLEGKCHRLL